MQSPLRRCSQGKAKALLLIAICCAASTVWSATASGADTAAATSTAVIPGPLRSFLRMAAVSQKVTPEEVLPLLARNVVVNGFQGGGGKPTEFLILLNWYMDQARELLTFAGPEGVIHVSNCAEAKPLLP